MKNVSGKLNCSKSDLNLTLTLLGGQSFRWKIFKNSSILNNDHTIDIDKSQKFIGVMFNCLWELQQNNDNTLEYKVYNNQGNNNWTQNDYENILFNYLRLDFNLSNELFKWKRIINNHYKEFSLIGSSNNLSVRLLNQEPFENIISFLCSQNNHITRITTMIEWFCRRYGNFICTLSHNGNNNDYYTFPTIANLYDKHLNLEKELKNAKFGYRAKYITQAIKQIVENGGEKWINNLKLLSYKEAKNELLTLTGIGLKVADCICLMSLNHLEAVPIDRHMYKIAQNHFPLLYHNSSYRKKKSQNKQQNITPLLYERIGDMFRETYAPYAGWAQLILFCSDLKQFKK